MEFLSLGFEQQVPGFESIITLLHGNIYTVLLKLLDLYINIIDIR